jgi:hypothetical protein
MRLGLILAALLAQPVFAQGTSTTGPAWNALARADAAAALDLIERHHPGAAAELGDAAFRERILAARANVDRRLPSVRDFGGHAALMNGLANDFRDGHIMSNSLFSRSRRQWAGLVAARSGERWVIGSHEPLAGETDLRGAAIVGCDGRAIDALAGELLGGFYADPAVEAQMASEAANLLLDHNNPFVARPVTCTFALSDGRIVEHKLNWRNVSAQSLQRAASEAYRPARAGMGLSDFARGKWIALESLDNRAAAVVEAVRSAQAELRATPMVVLDLRGNSGGNSQYADEIADVLVGRARLDAVRQPPSCTGVYWRASADNAAALRKFTSELPPDRAAEWRAQADALEQAVAAKRAFSPDLPACARADSAPRPVPARLPPMAMKGQLVLLTDRACFSSCLMAADLFRRLGARHVGEATDVTTRYMEVREIVLPSGLRTFSTLQKVALGTGSYGPYVPSIRYPGSLAEDDKVKAWVAALPR